MIIYKLTNLINGKCYIGQSKHDSIYRRMKDHRSGSKTSMPIAIAIKEFGENNFSKEILCKTDCPKLLDILEDNFINAYDSMNPEKGYNKRHGGKNGGYTKNMKERISKINKNNKYCVGRRQSDESLGATRKKIVCSNGKLYAGIKVAAQELGLCAGNISQVLKEKLFHTGGYSFVYLKDYNSQEVV